jgi:hypothetical protein
VKRLIAVEIADDALGDAERMAIVEGAMVGDARDPAVHLGPASSSAVTTSPVAAQPAAARREDRAPPAMMLSSDIAGT